MSRWFVGDELPISSSANRRLFLLLAQLADARERAMQLKHMRGRLQAIEKQIRDMTSTLEADNRGMNEEERSQLDQWATEHSQLEKDIEQLSKFEARSKSLDDSDSSYQQARDRQLFAERRKSHSDSDDPDRPLTSYDRCRAITAWALGKRCKDTVGRQLAEKLGMPLDQSEIDLSFSRGSDLNGIPFSPPRTVQEARRQEDARREMRNRQVAQYEHRAQAVTFGTDGIPNPASITAGGATVPDEMMGPFEVAMLAWGGMRQVATIMSTATGSKLPIPDANDTTQKGAILAENTQIAEQDITVGQLTLGSYKFTSKMIRVSMELMQDSVVNLPAFLGEALGTRIGRISNEYFTTGTGTSQPRGIVTAAANSGVTGGTPLKLTYPEILTLKHSVDPAYRANAVFMMHDATLLKMKTMVDTQNRPIWLPSLVPGEPGSFDGDRYVINQDMPSAVSTKGLIYGDLSKYIIREVRGITLMRLEERYADYLQTAFLAVARYDGDLHNAGTNPVKYLTLAAAT